MLLIHYHDSMLLWYFTSSPMLSLRVLMLILLLFSCIRQWSFCRGKRVYLRHIRTSASSPSAGGESLFATYSHIRQWSFCRRKRVCLRPICTSKLHSILVSLLFSSPHAKVFSTLHSPMTLLQGEESLFATYSHIPQWSFCRRIGNAAEPHRCHV
jgi:hypothetical protein